METSARSRPPKLGPRKASAQCSCPATYRTPLRASSTPNIQKTGSPASGPPRPPKLGPRKASQQVSNVHTSKSSSNLPPRSPQKQATNTSSSEEAEKSPSMVQETSGAIPNKLQNTQVPPKLKARRSQIDTEPESQAEDEVAAAKPAPLKGLPKLAPRAMPREGAVEKAHETKMKEENSLTTMLNPRQRTQLIILLAAATASMRDRLTDVFEAMGSSSPDLRRSINMTEDEKIMNPDVDPGTADVTALDKERKAIAQAEKEVNSARMKELRAAAEEWFDTWREAVIGRVGEVLNSASEAKGEMKNIETENSKPTIKTPEERKIDAAGDRDNKHTDEDSQVVLNELYPPVRTPLMKLDHDTRTMILHSVLLLLLSTEHYASTSRVLLLFLISSLDLPLDMLQKDEDKTAQGLLESANELSGTFEAQKKAEQNEKARKWKVGLASVAGAALIGVTGSLAAPLVAAGVGSVMGGLGLGATTAATYLGSVAGSSILVGSLFGAYGGRMTGQMMDNYAKDVSDFAFIPIHPQKRHLLDSRKSERAESEAGKRHPSSRKLRVTIGISGWLTEKEEVVKPWSVFSQGSEAFALRWELETLLKLGNAMTELMGSMAWGYAQKTFISQTIFADLAGAMWPLALVKAARVVDNPFSVAKNRAEKAGEVLADALINHAQGERPVNLIGYSLGARVIYACLTSLADRKAFGLIENVALIGAPVPSRSFEWRRMRAVVAGRLINVFSENDYVLGFLYRTSSIQYGIAGLQRIEGVAGVENVDVSPTVSGHLRYRFMVGHILKRIGFEDLDLEEVQREEEALERRDEEEREKMDKLKKLPSRLTQSQDEEGEMSEADAEKEADEMVQNVETRTQRTMMQRGAELLHLSTNPAEKKLAPDQSRSTYLSHITPGWASKRATSEKTKPQAAETKEYPSPAVESPAQKSYLAMVSERLPHPKSLSGSKATEDSEIHDGKIEAQEPSSINGSESTPKSYVRRAANAMPSLTRKTAG